MKEIIIRIEKKIWEIPQILVERDLWKSSPNAVRDQSMWNCLFFVSFQTIYKYFEYSSSTLHDKWFGVRYMFNACTISPFRKKKKKRSRSSSSSSSSSSKSQKEEDLPHGKSDPKDKGFNRARLGQVESPGSVERGRPRGGFVSLMHDVGLMKEHSLEQWLCRVTLYIQLSQLAVYQCFSIPFLFL